MGFNIDGMGAFARSVRHATGKGARTGLVSLERNLDRRITGFVHEVGQQRRSGAIDAETAAMLLGQRGILPGSSQHAAAMSDVARSSALLTYGGPTNYLPMRHLRGELVQRGVDVRIARNDTLSLSEGVLRIDGVPFPTPEVIVARGVKNEFLPMFEDLASEGVHLVNRPASIDVGRSKAAMSTVFVDNGIPAPHTIVVNDASDLHRAADEIGLPMIVKTSRGSGGKGVFKIESADDLKQIQVQFLDRPTPRLLVAQEYIADSAGVDRRAFVVRRPDGEHDLAAVVQREGGGGDFRANGPSGGTVRRIDPTGADAEFSQRDVDTAIRAAKAFDLDVIGVDIGLTGHVWEVNTTPGIPELDAFLPRSEHTLPRIADYAVYGVRR